MTCSIKNIIFNEFSKAVVTSLFDYIEQILPSSSHLLNSFYLYLIVLNPTIRHERDRYVKCVLYNNHVSVLLWKYFVKVFGFNRFMHFYHLISFHI